MKLRDDVVDRSGPGPDVGHAGAALDPQVLSGWQYIIACGELSKIVSPADCSEEEADSLGPASEPPLNTSESKLDGAPPSMVMPQRARHASVASIELGLLAESKAHRRAHSPPAESIPGNEVCPSRRFRVQGLPHGALVQNVKKS